MAKTTWLIICNYITLPKMLSQKILVFFQLVQVSQITMHKIACIKFFVTVFYSVVMFCYDSLWTYGQALHWNCEYSFRFQLDLFMVID